MSQGKFTVAEDGHIVSIIPPVDITGAATTSDAWKMSDYQHASIILTMGVTGAASTVTLEECTDAAGNNNVAIPFGYYEETTAAGDTLSDRTAVANTGFATSLNNGIIYVIEVEASQLTSTKPWLRLMLSNPGASTIASAVVILSGARYSRPASLTAIV
jgi:hypothetical protein